MVDDGKRTARRFDGRAQLDGEAWPSRGFAFINWLEQGDSLGQTDYRKNARNFNPMMATDATSHRRSRRVG